MTPEGARKAVEAGARGIVVSNHGGRVLDETPATIEVLPEIVKAVGGKITILIDGGFRTGLGRLQGPCPGGGRRADRSALRLRRLRGRRGGGGLRTCRKVRAELEEAMVMTGAARILRHRPLQGDPSNPRQGRALRQYSTAVSCAEP
ncbi:MAG: alpha-hydroxy-acid oxidizing protein [Candidatus Moduliflexus flocculans]|nr:alpha-hydroxy-acid oxidizing protein [Candidatus Moduliflexus flocculans]